MPAKKKAESLDAFLSFRLPRREKEIIVEKASLAAGISASEFLRRAALGRAILSATDEVMVRELRRLGGLQKLSVNELTSFVRTVPEDYERQISVLIRACRENLAAIRVAIETVTNYGTPNGH